MDERQNNTKDHPSDDGADKIKPEHVETQTDKMLEDTRREHTDENRNNRTKILIAAAVVILLIIGGFLYISTTSEDGTNDNSSADSSNQTSEEKPTIAEDTPDEFGSIIYAHSASTSIPRSLFSRPATGGDREPLDFDFGQNTFIQFDRDETSYMVANRDKQVYYATNSETPKLVFTAANEISSVHLDNSANTLAIVERAEANFSPGSTTITIVDTNGNNKKEFFSEDAAQETNGFIFAEHWDGENETLFVRRSCVQCDASSPDLFALAADGTETLIFGDDREPSTFSGSYTFNDDHTKALFVRHTNYDANEGQKLGLSDGLDGFLGAPFTLVELDIASGDTVDIKTFGSGDDAPDSGFFQTPVLFWANGTTERPAYSYLQKLFVQNGNGSFDNYFETGQGPITSIYGVDDNEVLVGAQNPEGETLSYYNIETQKGAIVMETLQTTTILGVTLR